jgi:hypothetical protein
MNYFVGLEMAWLQKRPSDKHLRRLAASLTHDQTGELYKSLMFNYIYILSYYNLQAVSLL